MYKLILFISLIAYSINLSGQSVDMQEFTPAKDSLKGKLIFIIECHEVKTNLPEYLEVIKTLTADQSSNDTLNVFLEAPFTVAHFINKYMRGEGRELLDSVFRNDPFKIEYYFALRKLKKNIRFISCDFEYDHGAPGGRLEAYKLYFEELKTLLDRSKIDLSVVKSFIYGIRVQGLEEADIFTFRKYIQKLSINQPDAVLKAKLKEANFVLSALYTYGKNDVRDKATYARLKEILQGGINYQNQINLMIYGSAHGNPLNEKSLYSKFQNEDDSPFLNKVGFIANIYIDCLSFGSYNEKSIVLETVGLYPDMKEDKLLIDELKKAFSLEKAGVMKMYPNKLSSTLKDTDRVLFWGIHNKVK
jgi:hypothetical protein